jgi:hypothetical protein
MKTPETGLTPREHGTGLGRKEAFEDEALRKGGVSRETTHRPDDARPAVYAMRSMKASTADNLFESVYFAPGFRSPPATGPKIVPKRHLDIPH